MKTAVITGAGSGIGRALVQHYAAAGCRVLGIDVNESGLLETERLVNAAGGRFDASVADLCEAEDRRRAIESVRRNRGADLFIHNAGVNLVGPFEHLDSGTQHRLVLLNLVTPMALTRSLLAENLLNEGASLVFMSSLSHYVGYPGAAVYAATKDGLAHYARSLRLALRPRGFHLLTVYPGPARTPMAERCSPAGGRAADRRMPPEEMATHIAAAVERRAPELIPGRRNRIFAIAGKWLPGVTERVMKRTILDRADLSRFPGGLHSNPGSE